MRVRWKDFELPTRVGFNEQTATASYAAFVAEPFERGFATTLGNALQRMLYSSAEGTALSAVNHHLAIDNVAWRILLDDLQALCGQLVRGDALQLPPKTTSFRDWARHLADYADSDAFESEAEEQCSYWLDQSRDRAVRLPEDFPQGANAWALEGRVKLSLSKGETEALLRVVPRAYGTRINDALLTALAQALRRWAGPGPLVIDLEGHGREEQLFEGVDLSRTVGWFTTISPVILELERPPESASDQEWALKSVKEQLRRIPQQGIGYGLLRYLGQDPDLAQELRDLPSAQVSFNYAGQSDQALDRDSLLRGAQGSSGPAQSPAADRKYLLDFGAVVHEGKLTVQWSFSRSIHRRQTIERLAQDFMTALRQLIDLCRSSLARGSTPSDFPLARLPQQELDRLLGDLP